MKTLFKYVLVAFLLLNFAPNAYAAIGFDQATGLNEGGTGTTHTYAAVSIGAGTTLLIIQVRNTLGTVTQSVSWNGTAMTNIVSSTQGINNQTMWALTNPSTGSQQATMTTIGSTNFGGVLFNVVSYTGTRTDTVPTVTNGHTQASGSPNSASLTTIVDNSWVVGGGGNTAADGDVIDGGHTRRLTDPSGTSNMFFDTNGVVHPAGNNTASITNAGAGSEVILIAAIEPPVAAAATTKSILGLVRAFWTW